MTKLYLVTHNSDRRFNQAVFNTYIHSLFKRGDISDWWNYIDNSYIVASALSVNNLYNAIFPGVPKRNLLIIEIDPNNAQGWMPTAAWVWLQKYQSK